jgi:hypothetical protein
MESPDVRALSAWLRRLGMDEAAISRLYATFHVNAEPFREEYQRHGG